MRAPQLVPRRATHSSLTRTVPCAQARTVAQIVNNKEMCVSGKALLAGMDCGSMAAVRDSKSAGRWRRTVKAFARAGATLAGGDKKGAKARDAIDDFCTKPGARVLAMTSSNSKGVNRLKDVTNTIIFMSKTHADFTNRATCDQIIGRLRRLDPNPAFGRNISIVFVKNADAHAVAAPVAPVAPAASARRPLQEPALLAFLDERGVRDKCEAVLADNEIDSLEALRDLTKQDMLGIGLKIGTVVKLQRK